ncbi:MAG: prepilin-type N-terminal cleavage/methylation domain-containing protein [Pseudomonadota bacterium]
MRAVKTSQGFTLIEIVVVVVIIAVMAGAVAVVFRNNSEQQLLTQEAERLLARLNFAQQLSIAKRMEIGIELCDSGYQFATQNFNTIDYWAIEAPAPTLDSLTVDAQAKDQINSWQQANEYGLIPIKFGNQMQLRVAKKDVNGRSEMLALRRSINNDNSIECRDISSTSKLSKTSSDLKKDIISVNPQFIFSNSPMQQALEVTLVSASGNEIVLMYDLEKRWSINRE